MTAPLVSVRAFSKTFAGRTVLKAVDLDIVEGEIHGLLGQNGSGKSTLIKILAGYHAPDPGARLLVRAREVPLPLGPDDPPRLGLTFVHQDLGLFEEGTVLENLRVGRYETGFAWRISWRREREIARAALERFGLDLDPAAALSSLTEVERAMVAIVRALHRLDRSDGGLLVLDEPTAYLPHDSVDRLFAVVRQAAAIGYGVLFVTHRLNEVLGVADRVSILRDGALVETVPVAALTERDLAARILGFSLTEYYPEPRAADGETVVAVSGLTGGGVRDVSFHVRRGEILGLTGLLGMGHDRIPYLLFGAERAQSGTLRVGALELSLATVTPRIAIASGLALLPADRPRDGGVGSATVAENVTLPTLGRYFVGGRVRRRREAARARALIVQFGVWPADLSSEFATLSGGNQQKALLAKWFDTKPTAFLLHEPTHGVDIGAKRQIFRHIQNAAAAGMGIIVASVEYTDLAHLCDRVLVFRQGTVVAELRGVGLTEERIAEQCLIERPAGEKESDVAERGRIQQDPAAPAIPPSQSRDDETGGAVRQEEALRTARGTVGAIASRFGLLASWLLIVLAFSLLAPRTFLSFSNVQSILSSQAVLLIFTLGLLPALAVAEYDLSAASVLGLSLVLVGYLNVLQGWPIGWAVLAALTSGVLVGALNALLVVVIGIPSIVATLGVGTVAVGATLGINQVAVGGISSGLVAVARTQLFGIQLVFYYALAFTVVTWYVFARTPLGRYLYFVGAGRDVARLAGLRVDLIRSGALVTSSVMGSVSGIVLAGLLGSADPTIGPTFLLPAFAGAFLGATTVTPGRFNPWGSFIAVYFLVTGITGLQLLGFSGWIEQVFYGGSVIIAVILSRFAGARG